MRILSLVRHLQGDFAAFILLLDVESDLEVDESFNLALAQLLFDLVQFKSKPLNRRGLLGAAFPIWLPCHLDHFPEPAMLPRAQKHLGHLGRLSSLAWRTGAAKSRVIWPSGPRM